jgi:hypothetical protein
VAGVHADRFNKSISSSSRKITASCLLPKFVCVSFVKRAASRSESEVD